MQTYTDIFNPPVTVQSGYRQHWGNLQGSANSLAIIHAARQHEGVTLLISQDTAAALAMHRALNFYQLATDQQARQVLLFPDWETLPYDYFSPHQDIISERLAILSQLSHLKHAIIVVSISTLMQRLLPRDYLHARSLIVKVGQNFHVDNMRERLESNGYHCVDTVREHGEFAVRGSIMDIYPMGCREPYRIDLLDDTVDTLRCFDPETQLTVRQMDAIQVLPAKEFPLDKAGIATFRQQWHEQFDVDHRQCSIYQDVTQGIAPAGIEYYLPLFFSHCNTLLDYLSVTGLIIHDDGLEGTITQVWQNIQQRYESQQGDLQRPILPVQKCFISSDELFAAIKPHSRIIMHTKSVNDKAGRYNFNTAEPPVVATDIRASEPLKALDTFIHKCSDKVLLCTESIGRREMLLDLLRQQDIHPQLFQSWSDFVNSEQRLGLCITTIDHGLWLPDESIIVMTPAQWLGEQIVQPRRRRQQRMSDEMLINHLIELKIGAPVVHIDHGVGRYRGLQRIELDDQNTEFLTLEYAQGAMLYVPIASLHLISRYAGSEESLAPLHPLGGEQWQKIKRKAAEKIHDVAAQLLDTYARRAARSGIAFQLPEHDYQRFAAAFPFAETPDQQAAIEAVLNDLQADTAMDRLICGDVGFGKTEVAMRAAFVTVFNDKQVAMLVPTTLLAEQHYHSFKDRFVDWPIRIDLLSRFRSTKEQKQVMDALKQGKIDILIGTHKLLQGDVSYQDLGLLIIDEEHRFGVRQKEQFKALRATVDILTLTATPIPRTLNMAMAGLRELSIIATPPARRLAVKTFVRKWDKGLIKEAIAREIHRGGQVYYLYNNVKTIDHVARQLQEWMPNLRIGIGHGQMQERQLEQVMADFYHQRNNILLCTTIIETGLDVPNANTIIIDRADKLGLAQLHQLRGRVGRSHHQAYAYLLTAENRSITRDAQKRLEAISEAQELGAGFMLATHDLEIRGAGELLGEDQSGQIHSIGFSLYSDMLERTVQAIQQGKTVNIESTLMHGSEINLHLPALIPDDYLPDVHTRLTLYKRIASAESDRELNDLQIEMIDRFGLLPIAAKNLFRVTAIKLKLQARGIKKMEASANGGKLIFSHDGPMDPVVLVNLIQADPDTYQLVGSDTLRFHQSLADHQQRFEFIEQLIQRLE